MKHHVLRSLRNGSMLGLHCALAVLLVGCGSGDGGSSSAADPNSASSSDAGGDRSRAMAVGDPIGIALTPVAATASASERGDLSAAAAIDHDDNTRWSSGFTDDQNLTLDFGQSVSVSRVRIN